MNEYVAALKKKINAIATLDLVTLRLLGYYKDFLQSPRWREIKQKVISARGAKCERCGLSEQIEVHHRTYTGYSTPGPYDMGFGPEDPENFLVLCRECHEGVHDECGTSYVEGYVGGCPVGNYYWDEGDYASGGCGSCGDFYCCKVVNSDDS